jgi:DNA-binding transcriptional regulator YdaS (Cro superfamily)
MRTTQAVKHFGSVSALARALGIERASIYSWRATVPPLRQIQIERITAGKLRAETRYKV